MRLKNYRKRAKKKGLPYDLDMEWARSRIHKGVCEATGIKFKFLPRNPALNPYLPSIDRIDPNKGYTKDNCQMVILGFNNLKSDNTNEEVLKFCKGFVEYYENESKP